MVYMNQKSWSWVLISRRSVLRAGTRLFTRGADAEGNTANFVETEQIAEFGHNRSSFVQLRGSIPLVWNQLPNLRYKPDPVLNIFYNQNEIFQKHINDLILTYGKTILVNLINHTGHEAILEKALKEVSFSISNPMFRYEYFDFHHECSKMRWDRLSILMDRLAVEQAEMGFFQLSSDESFYTIQEGIFRTNCIDSLDRTNVVQSLLAKKSLEERLKRFSVLSVEEKIEDYYDFYQTFRNGNLL